MKTLFMKLNLGGVLTFKKHLFDTRSKEWQSKKKKKFIDVSQKTIFK